MLDREVVLVQVVEVEGRAQRVRGRLQAHQADERGEVGADVQAVFEAFDEGWDVELLAVAGDEAVIREGILRCERSLAIVYCGPVEQSLTSPGHGERTI
jgi:hypothetical protein